MSSNICPAIERRILASACDEALEISISIIVQQLSEDCMLITLSFAFKQLMGNVKF